MRAKNVDEIDTWHVYLSVSVLIVMSREKVYFSNSVQTTSIWATAMMTIR